MDTVSSAAGLVLGVDVGGTFTDFLYWDSSTGRDGITAYKRPSTPDDPSRSIILGIDEMGIRPRWVVHGSTVATNAVLERRGARTALLTSQGCRDILEIGRQTRPKLYDLKPSRPLPIVPAELRFEFDERIDHTGSVLVPLDEAEVERVIRALQGKGVESIAVSLLYSFLRPDHEERIARAFAGSGLPVSVSHLVSPEHREYERTSTTAINAYVAPVMARYLGALAPDLDIRGVSGLRIMQSDGGSGSPESAGRFAARTLLSGPAGGVGGAFAVATLAGFDHCITFDMGGTSTDVALCPGQILERQEIEIDGIPVRTPAIDIHTVGAGGGSIARIDSGGALRVGPQSAGADPGPACYGRGILPTVTDAQLVLGRIAPAHFLGGRMAISPERAASAIDSIAHAFGGDRMAAAEAVVAVADSNMVRAIRVISVERGYDPRLFTLVTFGGAGGLHACSLADALEIPRVLVPAFPGVLSAFGMARSNTTKSYAASLLGVTAVGMPHTLEQLSVNFMTLEAAALKDFADEGAGGPIRFDRLVEMRYVGQSFEIPVPFDGSDLPAAFAAFHRAHDERYGHSDLSRPVEFVNARLKAVVLGLPVTPPEVEAGGEDPGDAAIGVAMAWFGGPVEVTLYDRTRLRARNRLSGPAVVVQMDATTAIPADWQARVDSWGNLVLERLR